jgi:hypothetical protein
MTTLDVDAVLWIANEFLGTVEYERVNTVAAFEFVSISTASTDDPS